MTHCARRLLLPLLGVAVLAGGTLAQLAVTATPAAAATPVEELAILSNPAASKFGQPVTFHVQVSGGSTTPTGTVNVFDGVVAICTAVDLVEIAPGFATAPCAITGLTVGSHSISASYSGNLTYDPVASTDFAPRTHVVAKAATTTQLSSDPNGSELGDPVDLTAVVLATAPGAGTPDGDVTFLSDGDPISDCADPVALVAATAGCTTTTLSLGDRTLTAVYSGSDDFLTSTSPGIVQGVDPAATETALQSSSNPSVYSGPVVFTATVATAGGTPDGTVAFKVASTDISGCAARTLVGGTVTCTTSALAIGDSSVTVVFAANGGYATSTSAPLTQTVGAANTTTTLVSSSPTSGSSAPVTFTATIAGTAPATAAPTAGTVSFEVDGTAITLCATRPITTGEAVCTTSAVPVGAHDITAVYSGSTTHRGSTSPAVVHTVTAASTVTGLTSNHPASVWGQSVTLVATVTSAAPTAPTGTVTFSVTHLDATVETVGQQAVGAVGADGVATLVTGSLPMRISSVTAHYDGAPAYGVSSATIAQTNARSESRTTMQPSRNPSRSARALTVYATVTSAGLGAGTPIGIVDLYRIRANSTLELVGSATLVQGVATITFMDRQLGTHTLYAEYRGSVNHRTSHRTKQQTVIV